jgi:N-acyl-D-aspartate/D-glutamate deacylase
MPGYDLVIRGGSVIDGTGAPARTADVAVSGGRITDVGSVAGRGSREIDADGALVVPGWVDVHTHYDAQATWDSRLAPSSWQGVTTAVMGNCGVGFAPVHDDDHARLIEIMEGVEDIPGTALHEGVQWAWNDFGGYLDSLERIPHDIDFGVYVPHNPLRLFVMGERGYQREEANDDDITEMGKLACAGVEAGALGFSTAHFEKHMTALGQPVPAFGAADREVVGIASAIGTTGRGVLQGLWELIDVEGDFGTVLAMARAARRPMSFTVPYAHSDEGQVRLDKVLAGIEAANAEGHAIRGQVAARAIGILYGLPCTLNPFITNPVYKEIKSLRPAEQAAAMRDQAFRGRLLAARTDQLDGRATAHRMYSWELMYELGAEPNYEPDKSQSIANRAARENRMPEDLVYDILIKDDGQGLIYVPTVGYRDGNLDVTKRMLEHPLTLPGLSDGGAHVGSICDASFPTTLLAYWGRDRQRGTIDVPLIVKKQCADTAHFVGLRDRGVLAPGYRADINVVDFDNLTLHRPEIYTDLPAGGSRLMQRATGYLYTLVAGQPVYENGVATGALPGRLVRGAQAHPRVTQLHDLAGS